MQQPAPALPERLKVTVNGFGAYKDVREYFTIWLVEPLFIRFPMWRVLGHTLACGLTVGFRMSGTTQEVAPSGWSVAYQNPFRDPLVPETFWGLPDFTLIPPWWTAQTGDDIPWAIDPGTPCAAPGFPSAQLQFTVTRFPQDADRACELFLP